MCGRTVLSECWSRQQVLQDLAVLLERALHLLPGHEFTHLLGEFPEFLKSNQKKADQAGFVDRRVLILGYKAQLSNETLVYYYPAVIVTLSPWLLQQVKRHVSTTVPGKYLGQEPHSKDGFL